MAKRNLCLMKLKETSLINKILTQEEVGRSLENFQQEDRSDNASQEKSLHYSKFDINNFIMR